MNTRTLFAWSSLLGLAATSAQAAVRLPALFSDHMVLQTNAAAPVWGWADPGEMVSVSIEGDSVVLSAPGVPHPIAARYGWADNPVGANLYNSAGLPAAPFRTDDWP